ncbi:hypothetical protein U1Q18_049307, partial [Sarracenia purpurea var. burkii]
GSSLVEKQRDATIEEKADSGGEAAHAVTEADEEENEEVKNTGSSLAYKDLEMADNKKGPSSAGSGFKNGFEKMIKYESEEDESHLCFWLAPVWVCRGSFGPPYFMRMLSGCWSVAYIGFRSSFSCLLLLRGCYAPWRLFWADFAGLFGGFRLSSGFAVRLCCFVAVALLLLLGSSCAAFIGCPIASSADVFGSPICALILSRVVLKPLGCFGALIIAPLAFQLVPILEPLVAVLCCAVF